MGRHLWEVLDGHPPYWKAPPPAVTSPVKDDAAVAKLQNVYKTEVSIHLRLLVIESLIMTGTERNV